MRSVIHALSMELFGEPLTLPQYPHDKSIKGIGMSDWDGYAIPLAEKLGYTNTYYHTEPKLDITQIDDDRIGTYDFLISSDVFEHIPIESLDAAFMNSRRLLREGGLFLFTVPFTKTGHNQEHFPRMHDFRIEEKAGKHVLYNTTVAGEEEVFEDLVFHGGDGMTLEMRIFSEPDLREALDKAGFSSVKVYPDIVPEYGLLWPMDWAVPVAARA
jgi:SAM-dependent methyltransferase